MLPKDEKCQVAKAPSPRGARSPHEQGKGKARPSEPLSSKPPLPRKPLLQSRTLPPPDAGPGELVKAAPPPDPRRETRTRSPHRAAGKSRSRLVGKGLDRGQVRCPQSMQALGVKTSEFPWIPLTLIIKS